MRPAYLDAITFEEFQRRISELADPIAAPPAYTLDLLEATGRSRGTHAELTIRLAITNRQKEEDAWIRVPLRCDRAILDSQEAVRYEGGGQFFLEFVPGEGYVSWLRGGGDRAHVVTLRAIVPLQLVGDQHRLSLPWPRATASRLTLNVPHPDTTAVVSAGADLTTNPRGGDQTELVATGIAGDFQLSWRRRPQDGQRRTVTLEVDGLQLIQIDRHQIRAQVDLKVQSLARPFDRFRVELPRGARLISQSQPGYTLGSDEPEGAEKGDQEKGGDQGPRARWVDVRLDRATTGPVEIRLVTQQIRQFGQPQDAVQLAGFAVAGAVRQSGYVVVQVRGDWIVRWREDFHDRYDIRRVDDWPDQLPRTDVVAAFEYYRQPYSLQATVLAPQTRVMVEPEYLLDVSAEDAVLSGQLKYSVRGAKIAHVDLKLPGWEFDASSIGPAELVDETHLVWSEAGEVYIPLARQTSGQFAINFRVRRPLRPETGSLKVQLPVPQTDTIGATRLTVLSADDVELTPRDYGDAELSTRPPSTMELPLRQHPPFHYLFRHGEDVPAEYAAAIQLHPRSVTADVVTRLQVGRRSIEVQQRLDYEIKYGRLDSLDLEVPAAVARLESFEVLRDDELLSVNLPDAGNGQPVVPLRLPLNNDIGNVSLLVRYRWDTSPPTSDSRVSATVPLVMPPPAEFRSSRLELTSIDGVQVEAVIEPWQAVEGAGGGLVSKADAPHREVTVVAGLTDSSTGGGRFVERAWLQTWLTGSARYDRAVFRFRHPQHLLELQLPPGTVPDSLEVRLNGRLLEPATVRDGRLQIETPLHAEDHLLDLRYMVPQNSGWLRTRCAMPRLTAGAYLREPLLWQLILPADQHLLTVPAGCLPAYQWQWRRLGWRRVPLANDAQLHRWIGTSLADGGDDQVGEGLQGERNVYLFTARELPEVYDVYAAPRGLMVIVPAGTVLLLGYLLIYVPFLRRSGTVLAAAVILLAAALIFPELALLIAQLACLGIVLCGLVVFLRRTMTGPGTPRLLIQRTSPSSVKLSSTELFYPSGAEVPSLGSTATNHPVIDSSLAERES